MLVNTQVPEQLLVHRVLRVSILVSLEHHHVFFALPAITRLLQHQVFVLSYPLDRIQRPAALRGRQDIRRVRQVLLLPAQGPPHALPALLATMSRRLAQQYAQ